MAVVKSTFSLKVDKFIFTLKMSGDSKLSKFVIELVLITSPNYHFSIFCTNSCWFLSWASTKYKESLCFILLSIFSLCCCWNILLTFVSAKRCSLQATSRATKNLFFFSLLWTVSSHYWLFHRFLAFTSSPRLWSRNIPSKSASLASSKRK